MIFLKSYFVSTTKEINQVPILHDIRFAIRDSQIPDGLATVTIPGPEAFLLVCAEKPEGAPKDLQISSLSIPFRNNELILEPKQMIYLVDQSSTGKRREFFVQIMGEKPQPQQPQRGRAKR